MGAWAYGPIDNDTAADWMAVTMRKSKLPNLIEKGLKSRNEDEVRAAAFMLELVGYTYMYDIDVLDKHLTLAVERLSGLLEDDEWLSSWSHSAEIKRSVRRQISALQKRISGENAPGSVGLMEKVMGSMGDRKSSKGKTKKRSKKRTAKKRSR